MIEQINAARLQKAASICNHAKTMIWVTFRLEGIHCWPDIKDNPDFEDIQFLSSEHRHMFGFKIWIEVLDNNREIEFIRFKRWCQSLYSTDSGPLQLNHLSCEMIADQLFMQIAEKYPSREVWISIDEDQENGCFKQY